MRRFLSARARSPFYRPSSCHGIVGSDGTGRGMWRGRAGVMAVVGFDLCGLHKFGFTGFGSRLSKVRCGLGSRAGAAKR